MITPNANSSKPSNASGTDVPNADAIQARKSKSPKMYLLAIAGACVAGALYVALKPQTSTTMSRLPDPMVSKEIVPVPAISVHDTKSAGGLSVAAGERNDKPTIPGSGVPVTNTPSSPIETNSDIAPTAPPTTGEEIKRGGEDELLAERKETAEKLASISRDLLDIKEKLTALAKARSNQGPKVATSPRPTISNKSTASSEDEDRAHLLAVDLWGGKPSIAVRRGVGAAGDITFLSEGEKQGRVTVRHADVGAQKAVLGTDKGEVVLSKDE